MAEENNDKVKQDVASTKENNDKVKQEVAGTKENKDKVKQDVASTKDNKNKNKNVESTDNDRRMTWIFVGFLVILLFGVIYVGVINSGFSFDSVQSFTSTAIEHKITENGENKTVKVTCDIEANPKSVNQKQVDESVQSVVQSFSYEQLMSENAMSDLKNSIITELQKQVGFDNVTSIYLSEYDTNYSGNDNSGYTEGQEQRNKNMKGLFPNMK